MTANTVPRQAGACILLLFACLAGPLLAAELDDSREVVARSNREAAASQQRIDGLAQETRQLLEEYRKLAEGADYETSYARELEMLDVVQQEQIAALQEDIARAQITRQRILPLMRSMAQALEKFVVLDLPFHQEQRLAAVVQLQQRLDRPDIDMAARFRLLLETYQLELDYGSTLEAWRGPLLLEGEELSVEFLRLGRAALYYRSLDGRRTAYWDQQTRRWETLDESYHRSLERALQVARKQGAPQMLLLPLPAPGAAS